MRNYKNSSNSNGVPRGFQSRRRRRNRERRGIVSQPAYQKALITDESDWTQHLDQILILSANSFLGPLFKGKSELSELWKLEKPFREGSLVTLKREEAELEEDRRILHRIDVARTANEKDRPSSLFQEARDFYAKAGTAIYCVLIGVFVPLSIATSQSLIQQNSESGSTTEALGLAASVWLLSAGCKTAINGPLKSFKRHCEILIVVVLIVAGSMTIDQTCKLYMGGRPEVSIEQSTESLISEPIAEYETQDKSRLFMGLLWMECAAIVLLCGAFERSLLPSKHRKHKAIDLDNELLERERRVVQRRIPRRLGRIAALRARKVRSEAIAAIVKSVTDLFRNNKK